MGKNDMCQVFRGIFVIFTAESLVSTFRVIFSRKISIKKLSSWND